MQAPPRFVIATLLATCAFLIPAAALSAPLVRVSVTDGVVLDAGRTPRRTLVCRTAKNKAVLGIVKRIEGTDLLVGTVSSLSKKLRRAAMAECVLRLAAPACGDGRDNDADGARDTADSDCASPSDDSERGDLSPTPVPPASTPDPDDATGLQLLSRPFSGNYPVDNPFDHAFARQFVDGNGYLLTLDGERLTIGIDGHQGYDYRLPTGTPLLGMADGTVTFAGEVPPLNCPILGGTVPGGLGVGVRHTVNGRTFDVFYAHLSRIDVAVGDSVRDGAVVGLSGGTGCSTIPHLHLEVAEVTAEKRYLIDPYGWKGTESDPWASESDGGPSVRLWKAGQAPLIYREVRSEPNPQGGAIGASVAITTVRWMGRRDDLNPNNEFLEFQLDTRYASGPSFDLSGYRVTTLSGDSYTFPPGTVITAGQTLRLYTGSGTGETSSLAWGKTSGVMTNDGDCIQLLAPTFRMYFFFYEKGVCPAAS